MLLVNKLEIVVITYNRSKLLEQTLINLLASPFASCRITILNNKSTDDSLLVAKSFESKFEDYHIVTNRINIGADANILRAVEISELEYLWILCDDDFYDFSYVEDVEELILKGNVDVIHMGAHVEDVWSFGGRSEIPSVLFKEGYPYFKASSFVPNNLFRREVFAEFIIEGYKNIVNLYPHMPFSFYLYENNCRIYIAKNRIVTAGIGEQGYNSKNWIEGWVKTSSLLKLKKERANCFFDQFSLRRKSQRFVIICNLLIGVFNKDYYRFSFIGVWKFLCFKERVFFLVGFPMYYLYKILGLRRFKN